MDTGRDHPRLSCGAWARDQPHQDNHQPAKPPLQSRDRGNGGLRGNHPAAGRKRLPVARYAESRDWPRYRRADDQQSRRHGGVQPRDHGVGAPGQAGRRIGVLRSRQFQRRDDQDPSARSRLRCLHVHAAQDVRGFKGRRRPGGGRLWLHGRTGTVHAGAFGCGGQRRVPAGNTATAGRQGARVSRQSAAGVQGLCLDAGDGRRGAGRSQRSVGAAQQLYGKAAAHPARRHPFAPGADQPAP